MKDYQEDLLPKFNSAEDSEALLKGVSNTTWDTVLSPDGKANFTKAGIDTTQPVIDFLQKPGDEKNQGFTSKENIVDFFTSKNKDKALLQQRKVIKSLMAQEKNFKSSVFFTAISLFFILMIPISGIIFPWVGAMSLFMVLIASIFYCVKFFMFLTSMMNTQSLMNKMTSSKKGFGLDVLTNTVLFLLFPPASLLSGFYTNAKMRENLDIEFEKMGLPSVEICIKAYEKENNKK